MMGKRAGWVGEDGELSFQAIMEESQFSLFSSSSSVFYLIHIFHFIFQISGGIYPNFVGEWTAVGKVTCEVLQQCVTTLNIIHQ